MVGKEKLTKTLREKLGTTIADTEILFDEVIATIKEAADAGEPVRLPGLGVIRRNNIPAHTAKNPSTGVDVAVPARFNYKMKSATRE